LHTLTLSVECVWAWPLKWQNALDTIPFMPPFISPFVSFLGFIYCIWKGFSFGTFPPTPTVEGMKTTKFHIFLPNWYYRDTAGQERFRTLTNAYYRGAMVSLILQLILSNRPPTQAPKRIEIICHVDKFTLLHKKELSRECELGNLHKKPRRSIIRLFWKKLYKFPNTILLWFYNETNDFKNLYAWIKDIKSVNNSYSVLYAPQGIVLVYDITTEDSFKHISQWLQNIEDVCITTNHLTTTNTLLPPSPISSKYKLCKIWYKFYVNLIIQQDCFVLISECITWCV